MKKMIAFLLILCIAITCVACGSGEESNTSSGVASESSSKATDESKTESVTESAAESSGSEVSDDIDASDEISDDIHEESSEPSEESSDDPSGDPEVIPAFCKNFLSFGAVDTKVTATSSNAAQLTGVNVPLSYGAVVLYTYQYEDDVTDGVELSDFASFIFEYSETLFGYVLTEAFDAGKTPSAIDVPQDGFLVMAHKVQDKVIKTLKALDKETTVFPHGVQPCKDINYTVKKLSGKIEIDGKFSESEWKSYWIEDIDSDNPFWSYAQFEKDNYYSTAKYYATYDDTYLYLCVVVSSPYHYCPVTQSNANSMWQYECIQVKFSSVSPSSEYILENFDHVANNTAVSSGTVRSYGFAANDENETCYYESGFSTNFTGLAGCSRDDAQQLTVYEVALPWAEQSITPAKGMEFGLTFSINSTNADDIEKKIWKNITYRNGGGVIGRNDWSKIPVITLG